MSHHNDTASAGGGHPRPSASAPRAACWAVGLSQCDEKLSREHLVSRGLWTQSVDVQGLSWCKESPKRVGIASLTQKVLCRRHNSLLSEVDSAGKVAFETIGECATMAYKRNSQRPHREWKLRRFRLDGALLERWFLKTTINLVLAQGNSPAWRGASQSDVSGVPLALVQAAFGAEALSRPMGLYSVGMATEHVTVSNGLSFAPLIRDSNVIGGIFTFRGFRFLIYATNGTLPENIELPGDGMPEWRRGSAMYHPRRLNWRVGKLLSHRIDFNWV